MKKEIFIKKEINNEVLKKCIFISLFILIIVFPYINSLMHIVKDEQLSGAMIIYDKPKFTVSDYYSGTYQEKFEKYYLQNFPYRNLFIKNYNQIRYNLFNKNTSVIIGKEHYLFEELYINEYLGIQTENADTEKVNSIINDLKIINNICEENGKKLYVIITPSKADFCCDYIPDRYKKNLVNNTRYYDVITRKLESINIEFFDSNKWLRENSIETPIFYKTGIHWSYVASTYVLKDFINQINNTSNLNLPTFNIEKIESSKEPLYIGDQDIYYVLNIWQGEKDEEYYKPIIHFLNKNKVDKKLFIQGGSYMWNLLEYCYKNIFKEIDAVFYQQFIRNYSQDEYKITDIPINNNLMQKEELDRYLLDKDIIIIEVNQYFMPSWVADNSFPRILRQYLEEYGFPK